MVLTSTSDPLAIYGQPIRGRSCGGCQSCCTLVPVTDSELDKAANERCKHLCSRGCSIYSTRPQSCVYWNCRWLFDPATADMRRPDHAGYIISPDTCTILVDQEPKEVLQIWVDPRRPDAYHDPKLRDYLERMGERHRLAALVRWNSSAGEEAALLVPASLSPDGAYEKRSTMVSLAGFAEKLTTARGGNDAVRTQGGSAGSGAAGQ